MADDRAIPVLAADALRYRHRGNDRFELRLDRFELCAGELGACIGPSGSGKSTLLDLIAGRLVATGGSVRVAGTDPGRLNAAARRRFRLTRIGLMPQTLALIDHLTALENIMLVATVAGVRPVPVARAKAVAQRLGIQSLLRRRPPRLSQGERQRVALARALLLRPPLILCDEPTGNLDPERSRDAVELMRTAAAEHDAAVLMTTHDHGLLDAADRVVDLAAEAGAVR
ncbi:MAG: ABC transporter ATP-binding protein [Planctomycetota bacterium]